MENVEQQEMIEIQPTKSAVAAIAAGILVIVAGFLAYNYFSKVRTVPGEEFITERAFQTETVEEEPGFEEIYVDSEDEGPEIVDQNLGDSNELQEGPVGGPEMPSNTAWVATDYHAGDIDGSSYTVSRGDTLWEVAEARYGTGSDWTKILEANKDQIGFLANGSQALIEVGQVLVLP